MTKFAESVKAFVAEWTVTILILLFGTTTLVQAFVVPTSSMESTIMTGDHMLVEPYTQHIFPGIEPYRDNFPSEPSGPVMPRGREMLANNVVNGEILVPP